MPTLSDLQSVLVCILQFKVPVFHGILESNFLPTCWCSTTSHIIFNMPSISLSGIPKYAGNTIGTTKNLHLVAVSLYINVHTPNCSMFELLYAFNTTVPFCGTQHLYCWLGKESFENFEWHQITITYVGLPLTCAHLVNIDWSYTIKVNIFYQYCIKASFLFFWSHCTWVVLPTDFLDCLPALLVLLFLMC